MASKIEEKPAGYLEGSLLIATPAMQGTCFAKSLVFVFAHDEDGAMGIVINHIFDNLNYHHVFKQLNITDVEKTLDLPVHFGGPVESERGFILHTNDMRYTPVLKETNDIILSSNVDLLKDIASGKGPKQALFALGYAGWEAGQLEKEIENNSWISVPASSEVIFSSNHKSKWLETAQSYGIDLYRFSSNAGHA